MYLLGIKFLLHYTSTSRGGALSATLPAWTGVTVHELLDHAC